jgi:glycosyltransferase involved in cell wall biosynthesis
MTIVNVFAPGHFDEYDSYGLLGCQLLRHLDRLGVHVNALALGGSEKGNQSADVRRITARPIRPAFGGLLLGYPTGYPKHGLLSAMGPRLAVTMFESTRLPPGWVDVLNRLDGVVVPSTFCRDTFAAAGVTAPLHVVPLGIGEAFRPRRREAGRPFTFLAIGDRGKRKGIMEAIRAFVLAFGDDPAYRLVIKAREVGGRAANILNPNIDLVRRDLSAEELAKLFYAADCMVFPSRGEGFGLPPREFAATGAPVIATAWSGLADDIEAWGIPLGYRLEPADWRGVPNLAGLDLGDWAVPDSNELAVLMRRVADDREAEAERAWERAPAVLEMYSWERFAAEVYRLWCEAAFSRPGKEVMHGSHAAAVAAG